MALTKQELIAKVAADADVSQAQAKSVVDATFEAITRASSRAGEVAVQRLRQVLREQARRREGRNPATGETIKIAASKRREVSRRCRALKKALN